MPPRAAAAATTPGKRLRIVAAALVLVEIVGERRLSAAVQLVWHLACGMLGGPPWVEAAVTVSTVMIVARFCRGSPGEWLSVAYLMFLENSVQQHVLTTGNPRLANALLAGITGAYACSNFRLLEVLLVGWALWPGIVAAWLVANGELVPWVCGAALQSVVSLLGLFCLRWLLQQSAGKFVEFIRTDAPTASDYCDSFFDQLLRGTEPLFFFAYRWFDPADSLGLNGGTGAPCRHAGPVAL
jgi:hypothetical protein